MSNPKPGTTHQKHQLGSNLYDKDMKDTITNHHWSLKCHKMWGANIKSVCYSLHLLFPQYLWLYNHQLRLRISAEHMCSVFGMLQRVYRIFTGCHGSIDEAWVTTETGSWFPHRHTHTRGRMPERSLILSFFKFF